MLEPTILLKDSVWRASRLPEGYAALAEMVAAKDMTMIDAWARREGNRED